MTSPSQGGFTANVIPLYNLRPGAEERNRTADTRIFSPLLYRLSYLGIEDIVGFPYSSVKQCTRDCLTAALSRVDARSSLKSCKTSCS
jgi:hypothetical protein